MLSQASTAKLLHFGATAATFMGAMALDVAGRLSPQAHDITLAALGAFGLSSAVTAFAEHKGTSQALEGAIAELVAREMPAFLQNASAQLERARTAFEKYLASQMNEPAPSSSSDVTPAETPTGKSMRAVAPRP